jgi:hypothetical protein
MLTFEEFFTKKKIDLVQLQKAEPALFAEFKKDFEPMGEKSFDHSKKFWFNKLRRTYHLKEEPKPAKTEIEITEIASQAEPLDSPTIEQKPAYTPRFKSAVAPSQKTLSKNEDSTTEEKIKPAYTPRFKPPSTVTEPTEVPVINPETAENKPKPAYTPRFKMQTAVKKQEDEVEEITDSTASVEKSEDKPTAYKPRFNAKTVSNLQSEESTQEIPAPEEKPAGYKPRFNIKNIKPKSEE